MRTLRQEYFGEVREGPIRMEDARVTLYQISLAQIVSQATATCRAFGLVCRRIIPIQVCALVGLVFRT